MTHSLKKNAQHKPKPCLSRASLPEVSPPTDSFQYNIALAEGKKFLPLSGIFNPNIFISDKTAEFPQEWPSAAT
jgi:hypothetical protein